MKFRAAFVAAVALLSAAAGSAVVVPSAYAKAEAWKIDPVHSALIFRVKHLNLSWFYGRFNDVSGTFTFDAEKPEASSVQVEVAAASVDTNNKDRDDHLRKPDFFGVQQFPKITFSSTSVKKVDDKTFDVAGNFAMHGVTKAVTIRMEKVGEGSHPQAGTRMGFEGRVAIRRSDFGMTTGVAENTLGDEVTLTISIEGTK
jgi:polyisoprenoid-binding protein YceI